MCVDLGWRRQRWAQSRGRRAARAVPESVHHAVQRDCKARRKNTHPRAPALPSLHLRKRSPDRIPRLMHVGWQSKPPAGPHLGHMRGREGRLWCGRAGPRAARAAGVLCGAGIAIPCASPRLSEPVFWVPRQIAFARPLPPGLAARAGRARAYAGQRGAYMVWCGVGRRARGERVGSALQGRGPPSLFPSEPGVF